jgi:Putative restriction endonuclease
MAQPVTVSPSAAPRPRGPVFYPSEDDVAESLLHLEIRTLLWAIVKIWLAERAEPALTLSEQFVYWVEGDPKQVVGPDLLVIPGEAPTRTITSWKAWEEEHEPTFAVEIVSEDIDKDYVDAPPSYDALGVRELVIYDPLLPAKGPTRRSRWQVYRREDGVWSKIIETNATSVESRELGCWLCEVIVGGQKRVRLAMDAQGTALVRTEAEAARAEAVAATKGAEAAMKEAEAAKHRARELEAELEQLRAKLRGE